MATYGKLQMEQSTFVAELDQYLDNKQKAQLQKKRTLHTEWKECVFDKIQDQLLNRVEDMDSESIAARRRILFQNYIDAARRKGGRLFLDIVIENEYDPFVWRRDTLRYRSKPATVSNGPGFTDRFGNPVFDPTMRDLEKHRNESRAARAVGGGTDRPDAGRLGRETLGHEHWAKIQATPFFDRAALVQDAIAAGRPPPPRAAVESKVRLDDFEFPGPREPEVVTREFNVHVGRGKRVWPDARPGGATAAAAAAAAAAARAEAQSG